jgi:hypothetical protein
MGKLLKLQYTTRNKFTNRTVMKEVIQVSSAENDMRMMVKTLTDFHQPSKNIN